MRWTMLWAVLLACLVAAHAAQPEAALVARAQAFWEAKVKQDYAAQHSFFEPTVQRMLSVISYIKRHGPMQYQSAHVEWVKVDGDRGSVMVRVLLQVELAQRGYPKETVVQEEWIRRDGEWYRLYPQG